MTDETNKPTESNEAAAEQQFAIQKIYLKDLSFESPMGAQAFMLKTQPQISQEVGNETKRIADDVYDVVLRLTITAKSEDDVVFLIEVHQSGIFLVKGFDQQNLTRILNTACPQLIFPYSREVVDSTLVKGGFPPLMLPPVNFEALFVHAMEQQQKEAQETNSH